MRTAGCFNPFTLWRTGVASCRLRPDKNCERLRCGICVAAKISPNVQRWWVVEESQTMRFNNKSVTWTAKMSLFDVFLQRARDEWGPRFFPCCIIIFWGQTAEQRRWWWWRRRGRGWGWGVSEAASLVEGRFGRCFEHERRHWPFWSDFFPTLQCLFHI